MKYNNYIRHVPYLRKSKLFDHDFLFFYFFELFIFGLLGEMGEGG